MTCPPQEQWHLFSLGLLDGPEAERLQTHVRECAACSAACHAARREHVQLLRAFEVFERPDDRFREQLIAALPQALAAPAQDVPLLRVRRWLGAFSMASMNRRNRWIAVALAPAACIAVVLFVVLTASPQIAFAQVVERMRAARTLLCKITTTTTVVSGSLPGVEPERTSESTLKMYSDGQTRAWLFESEVAGQTSRTLMRPEGGYVTTGEQQFTFTQAERPEHGEGWASPTEWVEHLLKITEEPDRQLGEEQIAGHRAIGFEIAGWKLGYGPRPNAGVPADDEMQVRVWVDMVTQLPVRFETAGTWSAPTYKLHVVSRWDELEWDVPLAAAEFEPPAMAAETPQIDIPAINEETAIEALRAWVEAGEQVRAVFALIEARAVEKGEPVDTVFGQMREMAVLDSAYPDRLDMGWLMSAFMARSSFAAIKDQLQQPRPDVSNLTEEERKALAQQKAREFAKAAGESAGRATARIMPLVAFYQRLVSEDRQPEYFGPEVLPGDGSAVLMRWREGEGQVRVIYGDLRAATLPASE